MWRDPKKSKNTLHVRVRVRVQPRRGVFGGLGGLGVVLGDWGGFGQKSRDTFRGHRIRQQLSCCPIRQVEGVGGGFEELGWFWPKLPKSVGIGQKLQFGGWGVNSGWGVVFTRKLGVQGRYRGKPLILTPNPGIAVFDRFGPPKRPPGTLG